MYKHSIKSNQKESNVSTKDNHADRHSLVIARKMSNAKRFLDLLNADAALIETAFTDELIAKERLAKSDERGIPTCQAQMSAASNRLNAVKDYVGLLTGDLVELEYDQYHETLVIKFFVDPINCPYFVGAVKHAAWPARISRGNRSNAKHVLLAQMHAFKKHVPYHLGGSNPRAETIDWDGWRSQRDTFMRLLDSQKPTRLVRTFKATMRRFDKMLHEIKEDGGEWVFIDDAPSRNVCITNVRQLRGHLDDAESSDT